MLNPFVLDDLFKCENWPKFKRGREKEEVKRDYKTITSLSELFLVGPEQ